MLNKPHHPFQPSLRPDSYSAGSWQTDQNPALRLVLLFCFISLPLLAVAGRVLWLKTELTDRFVARFEETYEELETIPAPDGRILSAEGQTLAYDEEYFTLRVHYRWLEEPADPVWLRGQAYARLSDRERRDQQKVQQAEADILKLRDQMWERLAELTGVSPEELETERQKIQQRVERIVSLVESNRVAQEQKRYAEKPSQPLQHWWQRLAWRFHRELTTPPRRGTAEPLIVREELDYHRLLEAIDFESVAEIESHPERFPGLRVTYGTRRVYPYGSAASHVIGHRSESDEQSGEDADAVLSSSTGRRGVTGVERSYDRILSGLPGERKIVRNRQGEILSSEVIREPQPGQDVVLSIDLALQQRCEQILDQTLASRENAQPEAGASLVVIDVRTGEVVACANGPRHDLSLFTEYDADQWRELTNDPRRPFFPRATQMAIAPGSVFKTVTAVSLLQCGRIDPDELYLCRGYLHTPERYRCYIYRHYGVGHGEIALREAIAQSCNVYFYHAGQTIGPDEMIYWADQLGFGRPTGIDLPGEASGNLPRPGRLSPGSQDKWHPSETLGLAIGQSRLTVTPLQIAHWMSILANNGVGFTPRVVQRIGSMTTQGTPSLPPAVPHPISGLEDDTLQRIREGMERVVNWHRGTGYKHVRLPNIRIAGKTGTAEVAGKQDHAWFAGYVPADQPQYAFAVVMEHGGSGGSSAGPVAKQMVEAMLELGLLEPTTAVTKK
jgi:penicillin-binding protein 2